MRETQPVGSNKKRPLARVAASVLSLAAALSVPGANATPEQQSQVTIIHGPSLAQPCFNRVPAIAPTHEPAGFTEPVVIRRNQDGTIQNQPAIPRALSERVLRATVRISVTMHRDGRGYMATGFYARHPDNGQTFLITAGHLLTGASHQAVRTMSITGVANYGRDPGIVDGCSQYFETGWDLAIMRVDNDTARRVTALPLARSQPARGMPVMYSSFQNIDVYDQFQGVSLGPVATNEVNTLNGFQSGKSCEPPPDKLKGSQCATEAGASGSPIVGLDGQVYGLHNYSDYAPDTGFASPLTMLWYNIQIQEPIGRGTGNWPKISVATPSEHIIAALDSSRLYDNR